jgi:hypothetical protein
MWAVGSRGTIYHWNGSTWNEEDSGTNKDLYDIWGDGVGNIWVSGSGGIVLRKQL